MRTLMAHDKGDLDIWLHYQAVRGIGQNVAHIASLFYERLRLGFGNLPHRRFRSKENGEDSIRIRNCSRFGMPGCPKCERAKTHQAVYLALTLPQGTVSLVLNSVCILAPPNRIRPYLIWLREIRSASTLVDQSLRLRQLGGFHH